MKVPDVANLAQPHVITQDPSGLQVIQPGQSLQLMRVQLAADSSPEAELAMTAQSEIIAAWL